MARRVVRPEAVVRVRVGLHRLTAERWPGRGWVFACPTMPDLAGRHDGAGDAVPAIEEFTRRAAAEGDSARPAG